jgi:hypothetical protein
MVGVDEIIAREVTDCAWRWCTWPIYPMAEADSSVAVAPTGCVDNVLIAKFTPGLAQSTTLLACALDSIDGGPDEEIDRSATSLTGTILDSRRALCQRPRTSGGIVIWHRLIISMTY